MGYLILPRMRFTDAQNAHTVNVNVLEFDVTKIALEISVISTQNDARVISHIKFYCNVHSWHKIAG